MNKLPSHGFVVLSMSLAVYCNFFCFIRYMSFREWFLTKCLNLLQYMNLIPEELLELQAKYSKAV